jgi:fructose-bisphosphate aldolase class I
MSGSKIAVMHETAEALLASGKGILAADENLPVVRERFAAIGLPCSAQNRRAYREMLFRTPHIADFISGAILFDEIIHERAADGIPMIDILRKQNVIPGVTVDRGTKALALFPGERITEGIDGLRYRLMEYKELGARFTKWRAVVKIGHQIPSPTCIAANVNLLACFASLSQEAGLLPVVEPEVLFEGDHSLSLCEDVTNRVLRTVFHTLGEYRVDLGAVILKANMVTPASHCRKQASAEEVAFATLHCLRDSVPRQVPGIVFLSGGQTEVQATERLNAIGQLSGGPWKLSFAVGRALQDSALRIWEGLQSNDPEAQKALLHRAWCNSLAQDGQYNPEMEHSSIQPREAVALCA